MHAKKKRIILLQDILRDKGIRGFWVSNPYHISYLSDFSMPEDARLLITQRHVHLFTDFRYTVEIAGWKDGQIHICSSTEDVWTQVKAIMQKEHVRILGVEADHISAHTFVFIQKKKRIRVLSTSGIIEQLRMIKEREERLNMQTAAQIADRTFQYMVRRVRPGMSEAAVAEKMEWYGRTLGAERIAFPFIVASGKRGALPHGIASNKKIQNNRYVTLDFGFVVNGYHSDMTRTIAIGVPSLSLQKIYQIVLQAQNAGLAKVCEGVRASEVDSEVRRVITKAGYDTYFGHATGHGVGLQIHELPSIHRMDNTVLKRNMVITVEPGIYIPSVGGVRIEDMVVVRERGYQSLSLSRK